MPAFTDDQTEEVVRLLKIIAATSLWRDVYPDADIDSLTNEPDLIGEDIRSARRLVEGR